MQEVENQTLTNKLQTAHDTGSVTHGAWGSSAITQPTCNKVYRHEIKTSQNLEDHPQNDKLSWKNTAEVESLGLIGDRRIAQ